MKNVRKELYKKSVIKLIMAGVTNSLSFSSDGRDASHVSYAHASWYGHGSTDGNDTRWPPSARHPHGHGAPGHDAGRSAEDGAAPSCHGVARGESQASGKGGSVGGQPELKDIKTTLYMGFSPKFVF